MDVKDIDRTLITRLHEDISEAENYQESIIKPAVLDRYHAYYADKEYYKQKFPKLSQSSNLVSTDVADCLEWALPSLLKIFTGSQDVVTVQGVTEEDDKNAQVMQDLLTYQLQRKNKFFEIAYNWFKDALITGLGIVKCYWDREEGLKPQEVTLGQLGFEYLQKSGLQINSIEGPDMFGNYKVSYMLPYYTKNTPKLENILISEFIYSPDAKNLEEADFVAHKKKVNMSYLRKMERQGIYANVDKVESENVNSVDKDQIEQFLDDNYSKLTNSSDHARDKVTLYECYTKMDINDDGILEDMIITIADDVILRVEENYMGRHPFFDLSPTKDPHRIWTKRSFAELVGELQDLKVALMRQIMQNIALTNDPKMVLSEDAINIDDYVKGRAIIRKKPGFQMNDVAMNLPVTPLHPWTFNFLEYIEGQKEERTGVTRYNQGLDAKSLNKTASGISSIMSASAQRLELIARRFAETGVSELYRFMVGLNQRFVDQETVVRLTNKQLIIHPEDLAGEFDLVVNAGVGIATRESTMMNLQSIMTSIMQVASSGVQVATPTNVYNLFKKWLEEAGFKNYADYVTDPAAIQMETMAQLQIKQQVLAMMPPDAQAYYMQTGSVPPQILLSLPPNLQALLGGNVQTTGGMNGFTNGGQHQTNPSAGYGQGASSQPTPGVSQGMVGAIPRGDNREPQAVPRGANGQVQEPSPGLGGF